MTKKTLRYFCLYSALVFICSTSALSGPMPVAQNDPRVSPSFAALGPMYEAADLIWSWVSSRDMNQYDAEKYCKGLGGGARLPTLGEWGALRNTMRPDGKYNPDLLPGSTTRDSYFWSSSLRPTTDGPIFAFDPITSYAFSFWAKYAEAGPSDRSSKMIVRCVVAVGANSSIVPVAQNDPRVYPDFEQLGPMYEAAGLIWSGVVQRQSALEPLADPACLARIARTQSFPDSMTQVDAEKFCKDLGGGARLPTTEEWKALARAMGRSVPGKQYNPDLLSATRVGNFWSSSGQAYLGDVFRGDDGEMTYENRSTIRNARCVVDASSGPKKIIPVSQNDSRVSPSFAALGPMFETEGTIWSWANSRDMNPSDAEKYCQDLGARVPTSREWGILGKLMRPDGKYNPNLIPGTKGNWFSMSDSTDFFNGNEGAINSGYDYFVKVRCVMNLSQQQQSPDPHFTSGIQNNSQLASNGFSTDSSSSTQLPGVVQNSHGSTTLGSRNPQNNFSTPGPVHLRSNSSLVIQVSPSQTTIPQTPIIPVLENDRRVSDAFRSLGSMVKVGNLTWSGVAPEEVAPMRQQAAMKYCQSLGGGARLPTIYEWQALGQAMSPGGQYNPNLVPEMSAHVFWSLTGNPNNPNNAHTFNGINGNVHDSNRNTNQSVRCVTQSSEMVQQEIQPGSGAVVPVMDNDPQVTSAFSALGHIVQVGNLIWSGARAQNMTISQAQEYCKNLIGGGARLPTINEWEILRWVMTDSDGKYNPALLSDMEKSFWSSDFTTASSGKSEHHMFNGYSGRISSMAYDATKTMSVRCVAPAWEARQIYVRPGFDFFKPVIKGDPRVPDAFADLGDMYESVGLIWSAAVPNRTWYKAESFCKDLGGEARLPSVSEWEALGQAMSKNGKYNPGLLPSAGRGPFWTSFMDPGNNNTDCAKYFNIDGSISCCRIQPDNRGREFSFFSVRCVIKPPKTGASEVDSSSCCSVM